ncbi:hypothetical protein B9Z55_026792 [Caenorhabditis nigoni]|uniref:F-box domain-containing protein n=1 Tax=Caenorhabditis nigoni TaxID=1611254 RepID=A0A2G5SHZ2_9PELO|nr:hypothetical protein B9Z55_026792 [Caenorhabditis nigoni]
MFLFDWFCSKNEQNEKPTITDMPYSVMSQILDKVGFLGTLNLRKTCKTFRNFIDDVKPINDLKQLRITLGHFYVQVEVFLDKNGYDTDKCSFVLSYQQAPDDNSWLIFKLVDDEVEFVKKMDEGEFIDAFFHDFESILKNQKSKLAYLKIKADSFVPFDFYREIKSEPQSMLSRCLCPRRKKSEETIIVTANEANRGHKKSVSETINRLETILKCRSVPLQTKRLLLMVFESSQVIQILRYVKTEELGALQPTREADLSEKKRNLRFDEISKCETYENIRDIRVLDFVVTNPISDFLDKPVLIIRRIHVSEDDILNLKRAFLTSSHLKRWQLQYEDSEGDGSIHDILGRMPHEEQEKWFYGIPNSTEVLCIQSGYQTVLERVTVSFTRINLVDVPENAWVDWE